VLLLSRRCVLGAVFDIFLDLRLTFRFGQDCVVDDWKRICLCFPAVDGRFLFYPIAHLAQDVIYIYVLLTCSIMSGFVERKKSWRRTGGLLPPRLSDGRQMLPEHGTDLSLDTAGQGMA
jgi:hypothetical protein